MVPNSSEVSQTDRLEARLDDIWRRGQQMLSQITKEHAARTDRLSEEVAACRLENEELRRALESLAERVSLGEALAGKGKAGRSSTGTRDSRCPGEGSTASGASSPQQVSQEECFLAESPAVAAAPLSASPGDVSSGASVFGSQPCRLMDALLLPGSEGPAAGHFGGAYGAAAVPEMPGFLMATGLSPTAPVPLSLAAAFGSCSPVAPAAPQEQRPLSLADALAAEEEDASPAAQGKPGAAGEPAKGEVFTVMLEKGAGSGLGLNVYESERERELRVDGVWSDGAVEAWNRRCMQGSHGDASSPDGPSQSRAIKTGDRIISVNGIAGDAKRMLQECKERSHLKLKIMRGGAVGSPAKRKSGSGLRADASVFVPSSAAATSPGASSPVAAR